MQYTLKKSLGQHFLKDENICRKIAAAATDLKLPQMLEVGPGGGALTKYLLEIKDTTFKAVELDKEKVDFLKETYPEISGKIIHEDMLNMDVPFEGQFLVIGNFPYNISSQILFKVLDWKEQVPFMIGMFQKEVALRIAAGPGSKIYGITSILIQVFYEVEYLFDVHPSCFIPPPKVMSGVIILKRKEITVDYKSKKLLYQLVKAAFNQRRKTLRNATRSLFEDDIMTDEIFNKRAEQLSINDFAALTFKMR